jgi:hypothetical protein
MSLTDEQIETIYKEQTGAFIDDSPWALHDFSRAIESAATTPLLERIAELEQRNRDLHEDVQRFKAHALNEKDARMALERELEAAKTAPMKYRRTEFNAQLQQENESLRTQLEAVRKDAERYRFIRDANRSSCIDHELATYAMESLDEYVDAAMEDEQRITAAKEKP